MNAEQRKAVRVLKQAERNVTKAYRERQRAANHHRALVIEPEIRKAIGTCYRYCNGYSSKKRWWLYMKVVGVKNGEAVVVTFQTDTRGQMEAQKDETRWPLHDGCEHISETAFSKERAAFKKALARLLGGEEKP